MESAITAKGIGFDTSVLVRYLAQDDPPQSPKATGLAEQVITASHGFRAKFPMGKFRLDRLIASFDCSPSTNSGSRSG